MNNALLARIKAVLATVECNHDHNQALLSYADALRSAIDATPVDGFRAKAALVSIATALDGKMSAQDLVDEIDSIVIYIPEAIPVPIPD